MLFPDKAVEIGAEDVISNGDDVVKMQKMLDSLDDTREVYSAAVFDE